MRRYDKRHNLNSLGFDLLRRAPPSRWTWKQIPDLAKARGITKEQVIKDVLLAAQPTSDDGAGCCVVRLRGLRRGGLDHRRDPANRRRLDRPLTDEKRERNDEYDGA
jgi:hypothetical protein